MALIHPIDTNLLYIMNSSKQAYYCALHDMKRLIMDGVAINYACMMIQSLHRCRRQIQIQAMD